MIGAMPAVAVRHERRKGQEKRSKRPSQLFIGGHWLPPNSPSPTPSPGVNDDGNERLPELYICGKVSALQVIVGSILLGAIVLIVGLVQLVPNAADADHRYIFIGAGAILLVVGFIMTAVRCFCMHCKRNARIVMAEPPPPLDAVNSIEVLVQRRDTQMKQEYTYGKQKDVVECTEDLENVILYITLGLVVVALCCGVVLVGTVAPSL